VAQDAADGPVSRRARLLRATGRTARAAAEADPAPPHLSVRVCPETHMKGVGLMYFASFLDAFAQGGRAVLPPIAAAMPLVSRGLHWFGTIDEGEILDLHGTTGARLSGAAPSIEATSSARRRSDGAVIAVCRTVRSADETRDAAG
jgi:probable biosynthetic protein (TIGR04098 family)